MEKLNFQVVQAVSPELSGIVTFVLKLSGFYAELRKFLKIAEILHVW